MTALTRLFFIGLTILLPLVLSVQLFLWLAITIESWLKTVWVLFVPEEWYFPGLALVSFLVITTLIGFSVRLKFISRLMKIPGRLLERIPLLSFIYTTIRDFFDLMGGKSFTNQSVVWVRIPELNGRLLGIVTKRGDDEKSALSGLMETEEVAVYLPMSYQAGGYMLVVPKSQTEHADLKPSEALHLIMSAGLGQRQ